MPGLKKQEENRKFNNFWDLIQKFAKKKKSQFFMDSGEGHELITDQFDGEDFSGWLIPELLVDVFRNCVAKNEQYEEKWNSFYCFAEWKEESEEIIIEFKQY